VARTAEKLASEFDLPAVELFQLLEEGLEAEDKEERVLGRPFVYNTLNVYLAGVAEILTVAEAMGSKVTHMIQVKGTQDRERLRGKKPKVSLFGSPQSYANYLRVQLAMQRGWDRDVMITSYMTGLPFGLMRLLAGF
jgi:hypothetical protein